MIAIDLLTKARNMLPEVLAGMADEQEDRGTSATRMRWAAEQARATSVMLQRTVKLPAVPQVGEVVYVDPYTEPLTVTSVTWVVEPDEGEAHVQLHLTDVDLDVLGEDDDALEMFTESGWAADR